MSAIPAVYAFCIWIVVLSFSTASAAIACLPPDNSVSFRSVRLRRGLPLAAAPLPTVWVVIDPLGYSGAVAPIFHERLHGAPRLASLLLLLLLLFLLLWLRGSTPRWAGGASAASASAAASLPLLLRRLRRLLLLLLQLRLPSHRFCYRVYSALDRIDPY